MREPSILICMSTYNGEKFLQAQLDSFVAQSFQNWQLIVHDDGSTDASLKVLEDFAAREPRAKVLHNDGHLGIKRAFLNLLTEADTDYYAFSDQDDVWDPQKLAIMIATLQQQRETLPVLAYSRYSEIDSAGRPLSVPMRKPVYGTQLNDFLLINTVTGCTVVMNHALRDLLIQPLASIDFTALHMHDWWAALVASALGKVIFVDQALVNYRQHGDNVLGAPGHSSFITRLGHALQFKESRIVRSGCSQAKELQRLYRQLLPSGILAVTTGVAALFEGWQPIKKQRFLARNGLYIRSKFLNLETNALLWMPSGLRRYVLNRNN